MALHPMSMRGGTAALLAVAAFAVLAGAQDQPPPCDMAKLVDGLYCAKCDAIREKDGLTKEGACAACKRKPEKVKLCLKTYFVAECCKTRHDAAGKC